MEQIPQTVYQTIYGQVNQTYTTRLPEDGLSIDLAQFLQKK